ncbi:aromatic-ring hydroxylase C-terminal domain-containing protein [Pseudonocardia sp. UM4_GMWB1]|uniref:aromatic-ring hydroxylase C-terminal domain-containing protein n=1 Tax=Pseudonocardia sp. UM4_GMWB1 TaxID=2212989 RepID=UPI00307D6A94
MAPSAVAAHSSDRDPGHPPARGAVVSRARRREPSPGGAHAARPAGRALPSVVRDLLTTPRRRGLRLPADLRRGPAPRPRRRTSDARPGRAGVPPRRRHPARPAHGHRLGCAVRPGADPAPGAVAHGWADRIRRVTGPLRDDLGTGTVLLRPDGAVARVGGDRPDPAALRRADRRWFGGPAA